MSGTSNDWMKLFENWERLVWPLLQRLADPIDEEVEALRYGGLTRPPASANEIRKAEALLGVRLPPEVREFFTSSNGFLAVLRATRVMQISELRWLRDADPEICQIWSRPSRRAYNDREYFRYGHVASNVLRTEQLGGTLVLSPTSDDGAYWLLNPAVVSSDGAWETWDFSPRLPGAVRYPSLYDFFDNQLRGIERAGTRLIAHRRLKI